MPLDIPDSDSEDELPPGWEESATKHGDVYYLNHSDKTTQWNHPRTGKTKIVPAEMPFGWERTTDADGKAVFVNSDTGQSTTTDPRLAFAVENKSHPDDFRQRFDASSTALQVLHGRDLSGRVAVVTGCNAGIGFETVYSLARHGCRVVMACRDLKAAADAVEVIKSRKPVAAASCIPVHLDLASLESVKCFAETIGDHVKKIDILILNAGVFGLPFTTTKDNLEVTFQINNLSHVYLALLLERFLSKQSRVLFVSSESHRFAKFSVPADSLTPDDLSCSYENYGNMDAYNRSKLCNVLCAKALANIWESKEIYVNSLHPGNLVSSNLSRNWWVYRLFFAFVRPFTKSLQQAASTSVYCATAVELEGTTGLYFNNCFHCDPSDLSKDEILAKKVFEICVSIIINRTGSNELIKYVK